MFESEYRNKIKHKPDLDRMRRHKQISSVEDALAKELRKEGVEVQQQVVIPNFDTPSTRNKPYIVDFAVPDKNLYVEIDGDIWHQDEARKARRDGRIREVARAVDYPIEILYMLYTIPLHLIYGHIKDPTQRSIVYNEYHKYRGLWVENAVHIIKNY